MTEPHAIPMPRPIINASPSRPENRSSSKARASRSCVRWPDKTPPRHVLFDFDGTLSLIREGWPEVMVPMMVEVLQATGTERDARGTFATRRRFRHGIDRQADDLPDDPPGRGSDQARRRSARPDRIQADVSRPALDADRRSPPAAPRRRRRSGRDDGALFVRVARRTRRPRRGDLSGQRHRPGVRRRRGPAAGLGPLFRQAHLRRDRRLQEFLQGDGHRADSGARTRSTARSCSDSATATSRFRTSRRSAARPWPWPATRPAAAESPTPGNATD